MNDPESKQKQAECDIPEIVDSAAPKRGRPPKSPGERRNKPFTVYFSQREITEFSYQITSTGLNGQEYMRQLVEWARKNGWKP